MYEFRLSWIFTIVSCSMLKDVSTLSATSTLTQQPNNKIYDRTWEADQTNYSCVSECYSNITSDSPEYSTKVEDNSLTRQKIVEKQALDLRKLGHQHLAMKDYKLATKYYSAALQTLEGIGGESVGELRRRMSLTLADCEIKSGRSNYAIVICTQLIDETPGISQPVEKSSYQKFENETLNQEGISADKGLGKDSNIRNTLGMAFYRRGLALTKLGQLRLAALDFHLAQNYLNSDSKVYSEIDNIYQNYFHLLDHSKQLPQNHDIDVISPSNALNQELKPISTEINQETVSDNNDNNNNNNSSLEEQLDKYIDEIISSCPQEIYSPEDIKILLDISNDNNNIDNNDNSKVATSRSFRKLPSSSSRKISKLTSSPSSPPAFDLSSILSGVNGNSGGGGLPFGLGGSSASKGFNLGNLAGNNGLLGNLGALGALGGGLNQKGGITGIMQLVGSLAGFDKDTTTWLGEVVQAVVDVGKGCYHFIKFISQNKTNIVLVFTGIWSIISMFWMARTFQK